MSTVKNRSGSWTESTDMPTPTTTQPTPQGHAALDLMMRPTTPPPTHNAHRIQELCRAPARPTKTAACKVHANALVVPFMLARDGVSVAASGVGFEQPSGDLSGSGALVRPTPSRHTVATMVV